MKRNQTERFSDFHSHKANKKEKRIYREFFALLISNTEKESKKEGGDPRICRGRSRDA